MPVITLQGITNHICGNTSLSIRNGELLVLAGATGAGKTTLLNVIAGLTPYKGSVSFDGEAVDGLSPAKRNVGYLFQEFALFPHLTVKDNVAFGLQARGASPVSILERVHDILKLMRIQHLERRYPKSLSGGEKQRVALARTLAPRPNILLLDEPFSSLDPRTAKFLRLELKKLQRQLGLTAVYVTHNQMEAFEMGDRLAVVNQGQIEQIGTPSQILFSPQTSAVSKLFGSPNIFKCQGVEGLGFGLAEAECGNLSLIVPYNGKPVDKIAVLPSGIRVSKSPVDASMPNRFKATVKNIRRTPPMVFVDLKINGATVTAELPEGLWDELEIDLASSVHVAIPLKWIRILPF